MAHWIIQLMRMFNISEEQLADEIASLARVVKNDDTLRRWLAAVVILAVKRNPKAKDDIVFLGRLIVRAAGGVCPSVRRAEGAGEKGEAGEA